MKLQYFISSFLLLAFNDQPKPIATEIDDITNSKWLTLEAIPIAYGGDSTDFP